MYKHKRFFIILTLLVVLCTSSCKKVETDSVPIGEQELPDMIMYKATYVFGERDRRPLILNAETITIYTQNNGRTLLENAVFTQEEKDENGLPHVEIEGSCDSASINEDNTVAKLFGNVKLNKKSDNFTIECDTLEWNDEYQTISTDSAVHVVYGDGTELTAVGFSARLDDNIYEFGEIIEGRYTNE